MAGAEESPPPATEWDPTRILDERLAPGTKPRRFSLVILNQPIHDVSLFLDLWNRGEYLPTYLRLSVQLLGGFLHPSPPRVFA